jgi:small subunit ribosomal protein S8
MHSDPVADMLTRIRNGYRARLHTVLVRGSKLNVHIAEILKREGYVADFSVVESETRPQGHIDIVLKYDGQREAVMAGIKRISTPGLRRYFCCDDIPTIRNGLGIVILTTSRGLMTDTEARKSRIGGEALCSVW